MGQRGGMMGGNMMGRGGPPGGMMRGPPPGMGKALIFIIDRPYIEPVKQKKNSVRL